MTRTLGDVALDLAAVKAVKEHVTALWENLRAEASGLLEPGDRKAAKLPDGTTGASIVMTDPKPQGAWKVDSEVAFLNWCKKNRPSSVMEVVRLSDMRQILDSVTTIGEVPDGVIYDEWQARPTVTVTQTPAQRQSVIEAWTRGDLTLPDMAGEIEA